jgi:hypothetical protein
MESIAISDPLQCFFTKDIIRFGSVHPFVNDQELLIEQLPLLQDGYALEHTCIILGYIYILANRLQNITVASDDHMFECFGGRLPAKYIFYGGSRITMEQALDEGIIDRPLNTYEAISRTDWGFNPNSFKLDKLSAIVGLNVTDITVDSQLYRDLEYEHEIVKQTLEAWYKIYQRK